MKLLQALRDTIMKRRAAEDERRRREDIEMATMPTATLLKPVPAVARNPRIAQSSTSSHRVKNEVSILSRP
jgi:hypothetical protein